MTLEQYTNLDTRDKIETLNSLLKGDIKFIQEGDFMDTLNNIMGNKP